METRKRNSTEIRVWMLREGVRHTDIKHELKLKDCKQIRATIDGERSDRRVLGWLRDHGCPAKHLALPSDMRAAA